MDGTNVGDVEADAETLTLDDTGCKDFGETSFAIILKLKLKPLSQFEKSKRTPKTK
jgi:hypothetical protein